MHIIKQKQRLARFCLFAYLILDQSFSRQVYYYRIVEHSNMNIWDVILPLLIFFAGMWGLSQLPCAQQDPLQNMNERSAATLEQLVQTKYFRIIRLNINQDCPLGIMNKICKSKSCSVCRCEGGDIPKFWTSTEKVKSHLQNQDLWANERSGNKSEWVWHVQDQANDLGEYFDIYDNIESFTNYNGKYLWKLIYEQNCFKSLNNPFDQMCAEERTLYNIISGLHTSISTHLSRFYKNSFEESAWADLRSNLDDKRFHFNHSEYEKRVLDHPQRIRNLFFIYRILAKAITTAAPYLKHNFTIQSDNFAEDVTSKHLLESLLSELEGYDISSEDKETLKFFKADNPKVKQIQKYIHNISNILNCVTCEKCRLFGKMQTYGVGTALKILLGYPTPYKHNEIVALINVFNKISMSIDTYYRYRKEPITLGHERLNNRYSDAYNVIGSFLVILYVWHCYQQAFLQEQQQSKDKTRKQQPAATKKDD